MQKMMVLVGIFGFAMFLAGLALNYWISKRRFHRRTIYGTEAFKSFWHFKSTRFFEGVGRLVAWALMLFGLMVSLGSIFSPLYYTK